MSILLCCMTTCSGAPNSARCASWCSCHVPRFGLWRAWITSEHQGSLAFSDFVLRPGCVSWKQATSGGGAGAVGSGVRAVVLRSLLAETFLQFEKCKWHRLPLLRGFGRRLRRSKAPSRHGPMHAQALWSRRGTEMTKRKSAERALFVCAHHLQLHAAGRCLLASPCRSPTSVCSLRCSVVIITQCCA